MDYSDPKEDESYPLYPDCYHDDQINELHYPISQFKSSITGKESQEELMEKIYQFVDKLSSQFPDIEPSIIFNAVFQEVSENDKG